jgi:excisionase family DNA binding protein
VTTPTNHSNVSDKAAKRRGRIERLAFSVVEAAEAIGRDPATLHRWISRGVLCATHVGGSTLITRAELDRLLSEGAPTRRGRQARTTGGQFVKEADGGAAR